MQRTSSSYSLPSSLAKSKIRGWNGFLSGIFSMHSKPCVLVHFRNTDWPPRWKMHQLCWDVEKLWPYHGSEEEEFRNSDSLSPAAPLGIVLLHDCRDVWLGQHHSLSGKPCQWSGLDTKQCAGSVCCSLSCYGRTCKFVGSPWSEQTLVVFKTFLCRQCN